MRGTLYSSLIVALISSGCTNATSQRRVGTYAGTTFDELRLTPGSEFVRANAENHNTVTSFVSSEPPSVVADEQLVNYPAWGSDLQRVPPVKSFSGIFVNRTPEWS